MRLLAMDTATSAITVAVHDGNRVLASRSVLDPRRTTEALAPLIVEVLSASGTDPGGVTDVVAGTGPGPFTGLRVGLVTARTFAHARGAPVHGVCSLDALAAAAARGGADGELLVATDARRKEVYHARYACSVGIADRLDGPAVTRPEDLPEEVRSLPTVGRGVVLYPEVLAAAPGEEVLDVDAGVLADLAVARRAAGEELPAEPLYLRRPDAAVRPEPVPQQVQAGAFAGPDAPDTADDGRQVQQ